MTTGTADTRAHTVTPMSTDQAVGTVTRFFAYHMSFHTHEAVLVHVMLSGKKLDSYLGSIIASSALPGQLW